MIGNTAIAQKEKLFADTISISIDSAEHIFLNNNLQLLAQKYNVDAQKALIIQAKLYPNPNFSFSTVLYQTETKKFLPAGNEGEIQSSISQMIILANKRNKQIKIAETKNIKKDLDLNNTKASVPKIEPTVTFSACAFGGVFGNAKLNNPKKAETPAAT